MQVWMEIRRIVLVEKVSRRQICRDYGRRDDWSLQGTWASIWRGRRSSASIGGAVRSYSFAHESLVTFHQRPFDGLIGYSN
jgi:hypothetical protein